MDKFVIIPDSASDFTAPLRERFNVPDVLLGVVYFPDGHAEPADLDFERMSAEEYYNSMKGRKVLYKTSNAPVSEIESKFEKHLAAGKDVLSISLSSGLSGSYQATLLVAEELRKKYPERKIICVDSLRYSTALSKLIVMACQKRDEGATIEETAAFIEEKKHCIHQIGPMDDLFFLVKTGRISNFKAFFGTLAGVNPMADFNREGMSQVLVKFKGKKAAFDACLKYIQATIVEPEKQLIFVAHSNRKAQAEILAERIRQEIKPAEVIINDVGISCGATIGPGLCAAFYEGRPVSEGLKEEQAIMDAIAAELKAK